MWVLLHWTPNAMMAQNCETTMDKNRKDIQTEHGKDLLLPPFPLTFCAGGKRGAKGGVSELS